MVLCSHHLEFSGVAGESSPSCSFRSLSLRWEDKAHSGSSGNHSTFKFRKNCLSMIVLFMSFMYHVYVRSPETNLLVLWCQNQEKGLIYGNRAGSKKSDSWSVKIYRYVDQVVALIIMFFFLLLFYYQVNSVQNFAALGNMHIYYNLKWLKPFLLQMWT